jgi:opacity protein-like surface antigen
MMTKSLFAAAAVAVTMTVALPAQEAKADIDVDIDVGFGGFLPGYYYYGYDNDDFYDGDYGYDSHPVHRPYHISCSAGRRIVDRSGFNRVKAVDCELPGYRYTARKRGQKYMVRVNGRGVITSVSRIY